ncbi:hypothetical protein [Sinorhizobium sp. BG8]|uniref:phage major capsid protein n=1 Tax=Sinorhizobium sp. BG8 TaxID=2613773 RepID=UPI00193DBA65|nr:hypothetical protein [Sinorhizobium sp. BG8]QRM55141.1 hypothetical protein F3Y30_11805 [Sinorhizobium sp. BG8]
MKTLKELREELAQLKARAAAKLAEVREGIEADAARSIEDEHKQILADMAKVQSEIERREAELEQMDQRSQQTTPPPVASGDAVRSADILSLGRQARMEDTAIDAAIRSGETVDAFRVRAFEHLARASSATPTSPARIIHDERETRRSAMTEALGYRLGVPMPQAGPSEAARQYADKGLIDMAAECAGYRGGLVMNVRQVDDIYTRASHTTSDFPIIFEGAINRTLEGRYALAQPTYRRIARKRNFRDFRPHTSVKLGDFPLLQKVIENGEIKYGTFSEGKETVQAFSYAIALRITRQMLINDDLGAIAELLSSYGSSVALFEEVTFYASAFNGALADTKTVFHADHGNLAATGTAITVDDVGKGRAALSKQKSLEGNPLLQNPARTLLVGPDKATEAEKLVASITPATMSNVNIFSGRLEVLETAQISGNAWHLFADPETGIANYRWGYLEGYEAPRVRMDEPFGQQGFAMSVEHDFGCGATDYRGGYKNAGA